MRCISPQASQLAGSYSAPMQLRSGSLRDEFSLLTEVNAVITSGDPTLDRDAALIILEHENVGLDQVLWLESNGAARSLLPRSVRFVDLNCEGSLLAWLAPPGGAESDGARDGKL